MQGYIVNRFVKEFKTFIEQGNVVDLAVAVVIGAAFTNIVNSIVQDLIMPLISLMTGGIDFSEMKFVVGVGENAAAFTYGNFISAVIQFLIIALCVFFIIKAIGKLKNGAKKIIHKGKNQDVENQQIPVCPFCLEEVKSGASRCPHCAGVFDKPIE